jgi:hypothetical protein
MFNVLGEAINIAAIIHNLETTERTEMKRKPSKKDVERLKRVKKTFKNCPL